jgi:hypothetical protein
VGAEESTRWLAEDMGELDAHIAGKTTGEVAQESALSYGAHWAVADAMRGSGVWGRACALRASGGRAWLGEAESTLGRRAQVAAAGHA